MLFQHYIMKPVQSPIEKNLQYALECWRYAKDCEDHADMAGIIKHLKNAAIAFKGLAEQIETHAKRLELDHLYDPDPNEHWCNK